MEILFEFFATLFSGYTYPFVFFIIFIISVIPILTPPTWIVIVSAYSLNDQLNPILLSMIGASAAISGRLILLQLSTVGRKAINDHRKNSLDRFIKNLKKKRYGYLIGTLLFALLPLPSNMLFISYGLMKAKSIGIVVGFWLGRFLAYFIMINLSQYFFNSFNDILNADTLSLIFIDIVGILMTLFMLLIDWNTLLSNHKLVFIRPKIFFHK